MLDGLSIANIRLILCSKPSKFWTAMLHNPIRNSWISYCNASPPPSCIVSHTNENSCCHWCPTAPLCYCASAPVTATICDACTTPCHCIFPALPVHLSCPAMVPPQLSHFHQRLPGIASAVVNEPHLSLLLPTHLLHPWLASVHCIFIWFYSNCIRSPKEMASMNIKPSLLQLQRPSMLIIRRFCNSMSTHYTLMYSLIFFYSYPFQLFTNFIK
jgi:hypothetical protein